MTLFAMTTAADPPPAYPQYAHQLQALLRRMARDDREAIGSNLRRGGFGSPESDQGKRTVGGRSPITIDKAAGARLLHHDGALTRQRVGHGGSGGRQKTSIDFSRPGPLSATPRQTGRVRIPHLDIKRISRTVVPRAKDGSTHPRYPARTGIAGEHYGYVTRGGVADFETHLDYITRTTAVEALDTTLLIDMLDMDEDRKLQNDLAVVSNIPGGRERERSLFEAAERCERQATGGTLRVSTQYADEWMWLAAQDDAPGWARKAAMTLRQKRISLEKKARAGGKPMIDITVDIVKVDLEQAYDRLVWCDYQDGLPKAAQPTWKAGPCGRIQTRFVAELPRGLKPAERRTILERFCERLNEEGWMFVGAIHRPDKTNHPDNFHFHVDAYDRPSCWLTADEINAERKPKRPFEGEGCWDFEYSEKKRNGRPCYPYRQNKIVEPTRHVPSADEKAVHHRLAGERYIKAVRERYVGIVNEVVADRKGSPVYATGTYRDAKIRLTPLEHLGPDLIAREAKGEATAAGTRNAQIMFDDEMRLLLERADLARLDNGYTALGRHAGGSMEALRAAKRWQSLADAAVTRRCQAALVKVVERMVRSRAETVLRAGTASKVVREEARIWLAETDAVMAGPVRRSTAAKRLTELDARADRAWTDFVSDVGKPPERLRYVPDDAARLRRTSAIMPAYRAQAENRLHQWVVKHVKDSERLRFVQDGYTVDKAVPLAIHRLFRLLGDNPKIQTALLEEHKRRRLMMAQATVARDVMERDHEDISDLPGGVAVQTVPVGHHEADSGQVELLSGASSLHDTMRLQDLPTIGEMHRRGKPAEPLDVADDVAAATDEPQANPAWYHAAPASEDFGALKPDARRGKRRAVSDQDIDGSNTQEEPEPTGLLGQAAKVAGDKVKAAVGEEGISGRSNAASKGPDTDISVIKMDTGQER